MRFAGQPKMHQLLPVSQEKHDASQSTFGLYGQPLDGGNFGCSRSVSCYCGPHIGCHILVMGFSKHVPALSVNVSDIDATNDIVMKERNNEDKRI